MYNKIWNLKISSTPHPSPKTAVSSTVASVTKPFNPSTTSPVAIVQSFVLLYSHTLSSWYCSCLQQPKIYDDVRLWIRRRRTERMQDNRSHSPSVVAKIFAPERNKPSRRKSTKNDDANDDDFYQAVD